jgi:hypothetical protein
MGMAGGLAGAWRDMEAEGALAERVMRTGSVEGWRKTSEEETRMSPAEYNYGAGTGLQFMRVQRV